MKSSEIIELALVDYTPNVFMCNVIEGMFRLKEQASDVERTLELINARLGEHYTLTTWLAANDPDYLELCKLADPDSNKPGNSSQAMKNVYCYSQRALYWHDLIDELKAKGE